MPAEHGTGGRVPIRKLVGCRIRLCGIGTTRTGISPANLADAIHANDAEPHHFQGCLETMIRKLPSGEYRLYSRKKDPKTGKRRNLGTFKTRAAAEKHERAVQFFKHH